MLSSDHKIRPFVLNPILNRIFFVVIGVNDERLEYRRTLPCGCILYWDEKEILMVFCIGHSVDYSKWNGKSEEFIKKITNTQREIGHIDEGILVKMR